MENNFINSLSTFTKKILAFILSPITTLLEYIYEDEEKIPRILKENADLLDFVLVAIIVTFTIIKPFLISPYIVLGKSMYPTYDNFDYLIIDVFSYKFLQDPKRYEVVVFKYPNNTKKRYIKRVIGLPGEKVEITSTSTIIYNTQHPEGMILDEPYAQGVSNFSKNPILLQLKENEYFVMGDNRENSSDSRFWGPVSRDLILGRVLVRLFPFSKIELFPGYNFTSKLNYGE